MFIDYFFLTIDVYDLKKTLTDRVFLCEKSVKILNEHLKKEIQKRKQEIEGMVPMYEFTRVSDELEDSLRKVEETVRENKFIWHKQIIKRTNNKT